MLKEGDKAPSFKLTCDTGEKVSLSDFKGKTVVLYFYPKDLTPGCTQQACDFRDQAVAFKKKKAVILGVSADPLERHEKFRDKFALTFPLLSDEDKATCKAYGVWKEKSLYGRKFMGIERTTFVIGPDGKIAKIFPKVKVKGHIDEVLESLP
jgi:thioredoxin-dependent peroxiredoxin